MAMGALLRAVRERLRDQLDLRPEQCDVLIEPPAMAGEFWIGVIEGSVRSTEKVSLREEYTISVQVWKRTGVFPRDRQGDVLLKYHDGIDGMERRVLVAIHGQQAVRTAANEAIGAPSSEAGDGFILPLYYTGRSATEYRATGDDDAIKTWMMRTLNFSPAVRVQALDIMK